MNEISNENLLYTALKYVSIDQFDKTRMYEEEFHIEVQSNTEYFIYHQLLIESIVDSIVDNIIYIQPDSYKVFMDMVDPPNTIKILRYFYIYNKVLDNKATCEKIRKDMIFQSVTLTQNQLCYTLLKKFNDRWIKELENKNYCLIKDEIGNFGCNSYTFIMKRRYIEGLLNGYQSK